MFRKYWLAGFLVFAGLLILAVVFNRERMLFSDASLYLFNMVKDQQFVIFHDRFIAIGSQVLPYLALKQGLPLGQVMLAYSLGLVCFQLLLYILAGLADRSCRLALGILFINILITTETFYWPLSELVQGMSLMMVLFALLVRYKSRPLVFVPTLILLLPAIVFAHPLLLLPFSYVVAFYYIRHEPEISRRTLTGASLLFILVLVLKFTVFRDPYDKGSLGGLRNFLLFFPDYFSLYANKELLLRLVTGFAGFTAVAASVCYVYIRQRNWRQLVLFLGFILACMGFVNVCFPYAYTDAFYRENLYMPLAVIAAIPFVYDVLPRWRPGYKGWLAVVLLSAFGLVRIYQAHDFYAARVGYLEQFLQQHGSEKLVIRELPEHREKLKLSWGTPYEFWLLSTISMGQTASIMIRDTLVPLPDYHGEPDLFLHRFGAEHYASFPLNYFMFRDSSTSYHIPQPQ